MRGWNSLYRCTLGYAKFIIMMNLIEIMKGNNDAGSVIPKYACFYRKETEKETIREDDTLGYLSAIYYLYIHLSTVVVWKYRVSASTRASHQGRSRVT